MSIFCTKKSDIRNFITLQYLKNAKIEYKKVYKILINSYKHDGGSRGIRTLDPLIKSQMLYRLS